MMMIENKKAESSRVLTVGEVAKRSGVSVTDFNVMLAAEYLDVCLILGSE